MLPLLDPRAFNQLAKSFNSGKPYLSVTSYHFVDENMFTT